MTDLMGPSLRWLLLLVGQAAATPLSHEWGALTTMMWADFRTPHKLTDAEAKFIAAHYAAVSLEKCTMQSDGDTTEQGQLATARQLKGANPKLKVLAYWGVDMQGYQCSDAAQKLHRTHPSWYLSNPDGSPVMEKSYPQLDYRNPKARDWWVAAPLSIGGADSSQLIDGILADGAGPRQVGSPTFANFSLPDRERLANGSLSVLRMLQKKFDEVNHGLVLCNGLNMYPNRFNPGTPMLPDYNFGIVNECDGVETEHVAAFESRDHVTGRLNITRVLKNIELIEKAAAMGKTVMMNMWAGPVVAPNHWGPARTTPNTTDAWRTALEQHFNFSAALYLVVAAPTVFFEYVEWYPMSSGVVSESTTHYVPRNLAVSVMTVHCHTNSTFKATCVGDTGTMPHVHCATAVVSAGLSRGGSSTWSTGRYPWWHRSNAILCKRGCFC